MLSLSCILIIESNNRSLFSLLLLAKSLTTVDLFNLWILWITNYDLWILQCLLCIYFFCHRPCYWFSLVINPVTDFPLSLLNSSCHYIYWLFLCHSWTPLTSMTTIFSTISPFGIDGNIQTFTCYAIEDFLSFFFLTTPLVIISPLEIVLPPIQFLYGNYSHILSNMLKGFLR